MHPSSAELSRWPLGLRLAIVLGFVVRLARPEVHSLWIDEGFTIQFARSNDLVAMLGHDSHPPLSFLFYRAWASVFGWSDLSLRLLPAIVSCASLALFAPLARTWLGRERATWAVLLYALSPLLVWIGHEVRMYGWVEFATLVTIHAAIAAWERPRAWRWALLTLAVAFATGVHYYASLAGLVVIAQALVRRRRGELGWRAVLATMIACAVGVFAWTPWFLTVLRRQLAGEWPHIAHVSLQDLAESPTRLVFVDLIVLVEHGVAWIAWVLGALCSLGLALVLVRVFWSQRRERAPVDRGAEAVCAALVPIAAALALNLVTQSGFQPRYLTAAAPGMIACIACGLVSVRPSIVGRASCATLCACALFVTTLQLSENRREDYRSACREIAERWRSGDHVLVVCCVPDPFKNATVDHYLRDRPDILASVVDMQRYIAGIARLPSGSRLHVLWREATLCWEPFDQFRRTHTIVDESPARFRIHRYLAEVP